MHPLHDVHTCKNLLHRALLAIDPSLHALAQHCHCVVQEMDEGYGSVFPARFPCFLAIVRDAAREQGWGRREVRRIVEGAWAGD